MLLFTALSALVLISNIDSTNWNWERYYYSSNFDYAEVNDITEIGTETVLCGGRWNDYQNRHDAELVLMRHNSSGALLWQKYYQLDGGTIAYGSCTNTSGNILVTGTTRLGTPEEAIFLIEINPSSGQILSKFIEDPLADTPFRLGFDLIQHSNGDYYAVALCSDKIGVVRFDHHNLQKVNWWIENKPSYFPHSWAYSDCLAEIPAGYTESTMLVLGYTRSHPALGTIMEVIDSNLNPVAEESFSFSCSDASSYNPGFG